MQNAECRMQNAECRVQSGRAGLSNSALCTYRFQLSFNKLHDHIDREQLAHVLGGGVFFEFGEVGIGHPLFQLCDAGGGDDAFAGESRVVGDIRRHHLVLADLDAEGFFQPEADVEKVDALGAEIVLDDGVAGDFVVIDAEGIDEHRLDLAEDFFLGECCHGLIPIPCPRRRPTVPTAGGCARSVGCPTGPARGSCRPD